MNFGVRQGAMTLILGLMARNASSESKMDGQARS